MAALDVLGPSMRVVAVEVGVRRAVNGVFPIDKFAEIGRQFLVSAVARGPERVAADGGHGVVVQVGYACWLAFVDAAQSCQSESSLLSGNGRTVTTIRYVQISMPPLRPNRLPKTRAEILPRQIRPDNRRPLQPRNMRNLRMDLNFTIILSQLELFLRAEVLVAEEDDAALCDQESELVSLLVGQVFELEPDYFGADVGGEVFDLFGGGEEGCFGFVGAGAGVDVFAVLVADGVDVLQEEGAGWAVLWWWLVRVVLLEVVVVSLLTG
jgi:hypothetical protein